MFKKYKKPTKRQIYKAAKLCANKGKFSCIALLLVGASTLEYEQFYSDKKGSFIDVENFDVIDESGLNLEQSQLHRSLALLLYAEARDFV